MCSGARSRPTNVCCEGHSKVQFIIRSNWLHILLRKLWKYLWVECRHVTSSYRSPTHNDLDSGILPMARRLRPKTNKPTPPPTTTEAPTTTVAPTRAPQQPPPQPNYPPPSPWYRQQQGTGAYMPQGYQYPPNYPYYAQSRPQQQPPQFFNPFMPYYQGQGGQPVMIPVPVPVPMAAMPDLPGIPNLMQPFGGSLDVV